MLNQIIHISPVLTACDLHLGKSLATFRAGLYFLKTKKHD